MMMSARNRSPFTASQWQELEHQALIFKYIVSGVPIPADLIWTVKRSLDSSLSSGLFPHQPSKHGRTFSFSWFFSVFFSWWVLLETDVFGEKWSGNSGFCVCVCSWVGLFSDGVWQESRPRAREVQKNWWQEMEVLQRSIPRFKILWETHAQRQKPFKKACGSYFSYKPFTNHLINQLKSFLHHHQFLLSLSSLFFNDFWNLPSPSPFLPQHLSLSLPLPSSLLF